MKGGGYRTRCMADESTTGTIKGTRTNLYYLNFNSRRGPWRRSQQKVCLIFIRAPYSIHTSSFRFMDDCVPFESAAAVKDPETRDADWSAWGRRRWFRKRPFRALD